MLKILVVEEYGYRNWVWEFPGSKEELIRDWQAGQRPDGFFNPSRPKKYKGMIKLIRRSVEGHGPFNANAHVNEEDDTFLLMDGVQYGGNHGKDTN